MSMKVAVISPISLLDRYCTFTDYHLALAHLVLSSDIYRKFYQERKKAGDYVILDNSLIELGHAMDLSSLMAAFTAIQPDEFVLPDVYMNRLATIEAVKKGVHEVRTLLKGSTPKLMAVPQGENAWAWIDCYQQLLEIEGIDVIGIPKNTDLICRYQDVKSVKDYPKISPHARGYIGLDGRIQLTNYLEQNGLVSDAHEYHLLGCWSNPLEIRYQAEHTWIRGIDTSFQVLCGLLGIAFHDRDGILISRPEIPLDFHVAEDDNFTSIVYHNIKCTLKWAGATPPVRKSQEPQEPQEPQKVL